LYLDRSSFLKNLFHLLLLLLQHPPTIKPFLLIVSVFRINQAEAEAKALAAEKAAKDAGTFSICHEKRQIWNSLYILVLG
jgi:hypothetical protein